MLMSDSTLDNDRLGCRSETTSGLLVHFFPTHCSLGSFFLREVEFHIRDSRIICQTACVLGHLQVNVAFLTPGGSPAVPDDPVRCWSCGVEACCHHAVVLVHSAHSPACS